MSMDILLNGQAQSVNDAATVADLLKKLGVSTRGIAVEVNGELVSRSVHSTHRLASGDRLEIVTLVGGG